MYDLKNNTKLSDALYTLLGCVNDMNLENLDSIDLVNNAWYLVKCTGFSESGYVIAQAVRRLRCTKSETNKYILVLETEQGRLDNMSVMGLIRLRD